MGLPKECELQLENRYARGEKNLITDVPGVKVGHVTLNDDDKVVSLAAVQQDEETCAEDAVTGETVTETADIVNTETAVITEEN